MTAIQCARLQGYAAIIATSSLKHEEYLKSLGATHIVDRNLPPADIQVQARKLAAGKPITYVYDAIGARDEQRLSYELLEDGGAFALGKAEVAEFGVAVIFERRYA